MTAFLGPAATLIGIVLKVIADTDASARQQRQDLAGYFDALGKCLEDMLAKFKLGQKPRVAGNALKVHLLAMEGVLYTVYNKKVTSDKEAVRSIVVAFYEINRRAENIDYGLDQNQPIQPYQMTWLEDMERLIGNLQAFTAILRAPQR